MLYDMEVDTFSSVSPFWCARMAPTDEAIVQFQRGKRARDAQGYGKQTKKNTFHGSFFDSDTIPRRSIGIGKRREGHVRLCRCFETAKGVFTNTRRSHRNNGHINPLKKPSFHTKSAFNNVKYCPNHQLIILIR